MRRAYGMEWLSSFRALILLTLPRCWKGEALISVPSRHSCEPLETKKS